MLDFLIIYSLMVYWLFHLLSRSDLCAPARKWAVRFAPKWLVYIGTCPFCFAWWTAWVLWLVGVVPLSVSTLFAAPVVNMVLDLVVKALIRVNEPPAIKEEPFDMNKWLDAVKAAYERNLAERDIPFNPLDHEQTK